MQYTTCVSHLAFTDSHIFTKIEDKSSCAFFICKASINASYHKHQPRKERDTDREDMMSRSECWIVVVATYGLLICTVEARVQAESLNPTPEGNTTFIDGATWCVARPGASQFDLENAIGWACGLGGADCSPVQPGAACYQPDTLLSHASYAFNSYYQQNGNSDIACYFGGTAIVTKKDPSYGACKYMSSETASASRVFGRSPPMLKLVEYILIIVLCLRLQL